MFRLRRSSASKKRRCSVKNFTPRPRKGPSLPLDWHQGHIILAKEIEMARVVQREAQIVIRDIMQDVRLGKNIESDRVKRVVNNMIDSIFANQAALASLTRIKDYDEYTFVHSINVCILCLTLGRHLNFSREELDGHRGTPPRRRKDEDPPTYPE